jgi:redox-sensitive bicupin YhaK (pirin superfamily)
MLNHIPYSTLGVANHGWLKAKHHFSFAHYYNPKRMGFGTLRVVNDDWVQAGMGFDPHPHKNMEIITFVRSGAITHQDNKGHKGTTKAGEVQVMSAGTGIVHSEYNHSKSPLTLYQIWIETNKYNVQPRWESKLFPTTYSTSELPLLVSGYAEDKNDALFIHQKARIFGGKVKKGAVFSHAITHQAYILASEGDFVLMNSKGHNVVLHKGDAAEVSDSESINIEALSHCEILIIDAP